VSGDGAQLADQNGAASNLYLLETGLSQPKKAGGIALRFEVGESSDARTRGSSNEKAA